MKDLISIFLSLTLITTFLLSAPADNKVLTQSEFEKESVFIITNSFKVLEFDKRIKKIQFTNSKSITAEFLTTPKPLTTLKIYAKKLGSVNAFVTFYDNSNMQVNFNVIKNLQNIIDITEEMYPDLKVSQINNSLVLEGSVRNSSDKKRIISIFKKSGIDTDKQLIDLIKDEISTKMVRVKLYVVQIDNDKGQQLINDWSIGSFNDGKTSVNSIGSYSKTNAFTSEFVDALSLTGGITSVAARMGSKFDVDWTLNYLKKNNAIRIMNESTLIMQEHKAASFDTGGKFFIKVSTTTAQGVPSTELKEIEYGLNIDMLVNRIINNKYIDFETKAKSDAVDNVNTVDNIPGLKGNSVTTNVVVENGATIVLAGILSADTTKNEEKIPLLGDIPIIGSLFTSSVDSDTSTDLVFFLTPEIIDPRDNDQKELLDQKIQRINDKDYDKKDVIQASNAGEIEEQRTIIKKEKQETIQEKHRRMMGL